MPVRTVLNQETTVQNQDIECPKCGYEFAITEALARPIVEAERHRLELEIRQRSTALAAQEEKLHGKRQQLDDEQKKLRTEAAGVEKLVHDRLEVERAGIVAVEAKRIEGQFQNRLDAARRDQEAQEAKIAQMERAELELRRKSTALDQQKRQLELTVARQLDEEREGIRHEAMTLEQTRSQSAQKSEADRSRLKLAEKDKTIDDMRKQVEELRRKSYQGSQQLQGEVQERELEAILRSQFPHDEFEAIAVGRPGGDLIQRVIGTGGMICGSILWESKRTRSWQKDWLAKTRENQRSVRASLSVIISTALPKGLVSFDRIEDVWVSALDCLVPLAKALRFTLYQTSVLQLASQDRGVKTERVYGYVTGEDFKQRVSSIMEGYVSLRSDLERERRSVTAAWAKREKFHDLVLMGTAGIYGDLHGILGKTLPLIEELEDPELPTILGSLQSPDAEVGAPL
jgi:hypothetical protein